MSPDDLTQLAHLLRNYANEYCTTYGTTWTEHHELADHCDELARASHGKTT